MGSFRTCLSVKLEMPRYRPTGERKELTLENPEMQPDWPQSAGKAQEADST